MLYVSVALCVSGGVAAEREGRKEGREEERVMFCEWCCNRVNKKGGEAQGYIQYLS